MRATLISGIVLGIGSIIAGYFLVRKIMRSRQEHFKVLGALGPYKDLYYKCTSECERSDPGKQLSPTKGNLMCQTYCDSVITDISRRGGPSYPLDPKVKSTMNLKPQWGQSNYVDYRRSDVDYLGTGGVYASTDESYKVCGDGEANAWCREQYHTLKEIDSKCRQDCEYSTYPTRECMELCSASKSGNLSLGWGWK